jgi:hypothetical protein
VRLVTSQEAIVAAEPPSRWRRPIYVGLAAVLGALAVAEVVLGFTTFGWGPDIGLDFSIYLNAADRFVNGGSWFLARQLSGPYDVKMGDVLYPVSSVWLFAPFLVVPKILWWTAIPIFVGLVLSFRPKPWTWPVFAMCFVFPYTSIRFVTGNPAMWLAVFEALGLRVGFPAALVLIKPTMAPFALVGARSRWWWVAVAALGLATLPGLAEYVRVVRDANIGDSWLYPFFDVPLFLIPIAAYFGRTDASSAPIHRIGGIRSTVPT